MSEGLAKMERPRVLHLGRRSVRWVPRQWVAVLLLSATLVVLALLALGTGRISLNPLQALDILLWGEGSPLERKVVFDIRLPRVLTALLAGAALSVSGAIFQSLSRNPLGSPDVIGFTTGAASGAVVYFVLGGTSSVTSAAFAVGSGLLTALVVFGLAMRGGAVASHRLVLVGIGVGATLAALNEAVLLRGELEQALSAQLWLSGSLNARTWSHAVPLLVGLAVLLPVVLLGQSRLMLLEMGDDLARQLGVHALKVKGLMAFCAVLLASLATGASGPIAFIALAAPRLVAFLCGDHGRPLWPSALTGALLLLSVDVVSQSLPFELNLPVGLMTALIGGVYLVFALPRLRSF
ncbi:iron chelate uptake ABC transporter family permease subunit [Hydrogenophaga sp.]|uniref:FecCD family ABC transporter permease n=1 Tax=Hydrogenophaga sp. TaxID=1904254 RepID=UPI00261E4340|nr:iron chelate uptake ABC transporter family permease subunit [Hydrogenophaga sp.]MCW5655489.1 iron chelate uptake ABC transporter family permease subunit [Hydrogenophaga sp.]